MLTILEMVCQCPQEAKRDLVEQKSWCPHDTFHSRHQSVKLFLPLLSATPNLESQYNQRIRRDPGWMAKSSWLDPHLLIKSSPLMTLNLDSALGGETWFLHLYNMRTVLTSKVLHWGFWLPGLCNKVPSVAIGLKQWQHLFYL